MTKVEVGLEESVIPHGLGVLMLISLILAIVLLYRFSMRFSKRHDLEGRPEDTVLLAGFLTLSIALIGTTFAVLSHNKSEADWSPLTSIAFEGEAVDGDQFKALKNLEVGQYYILKTRSLVVLRESREEFIVTRLKDKDED